MTVHATLHGTITDTGGENCDERGFEWGYSSGNYPYNWTETGSFETGSFSHQVTGLNEGVTVYFRAKAHNSAGWGYGSEKSFNTPKTWSQTLTQDLDLTDISSKAQKIFKSQLLGLAEIKSKKPFAVKVESLNLFDTFTKIWSIQKEYEETLEYFDFTFKKVFAKEQEITELGDFKSLIPRFKILSSLSFLSELTASYLFTSLFEEWLNTAFFEVDHFDESSFEVGTIRLNSISSKKDESLGLISLLGIFQTFKRVFSQSLLITDLISKGISLKYLASLSLSDLKKALVSKFYLESLIFTSILFEKFSKVLQDMMSFLETLSFNFKKLFSMTLGLIEARSSLFTTTRTGFLSLSDKLAFLFKVLVPHSLSLYEALKRKLLAMRLQTLSLLDEITTSIGALLTQLLEELITLSEQLTKFSINLRTGTISLVETLSKRSFRTFSQMLYLEDWYRLVSVFSRKSQETFVLTGLLFFSSFKKIVISLALTPKISSFFSRISSQVLVFSDFLMKKTTALKEELLSLSSQIFHVLSILSTELLSFLAIFKFRVSMILEAFISLISEEFKKTVRSLKDSISFLKALFLKSAYTRNFPELISLLESAKPLTQFTRVFLQLLNLTYAFTRVVSFRRVFLEILSSSEKLFKLLKKLTTGTLSIFGSLALQIHTFKVETFSFISKIFKVPYFLLEEILIVFSEISKIFNSPRKETLLLISKTFKTFSYVKQEFLTLISKIVCTFDVIKKESLTFLIGFSFLLKKKLLQALKLTPLFTRVFESSRNYLESLDLTDSISGTLGKFLTLFETLNLASFLSFLTSFSRLFTQSLILIETPLLAFSKKLENTLILLSSSLKTFGARILTILHLLPRFSFEAFKSLKDTLYLISLFKKEFTVLRSILEEVTFLDKYLITLEKKILEIVTLESLVKFFTRAISYGTLILVSKTSNRIRIAKEESLQFLSKISSLISKKITALINLQETIETTFIEALYKTLSESISLLSLLRVNILKRIETTLSILGVLFKSSKIALSETLTFLVFYSRKVSFRKIYDETLELISILRKKIERISLETLNFILKIFETFKKKLLETKVLTATLTKIIYHLFSLSLQEVITLTSLIAKFFKKEILGSLKAVEITFRKSMISFKETLKTSLVLTIFRTFLRLLTQTLKLFGAVSTKTVFRKLLISYLNLKVFFLRRVSYFRTLKLKLSLKGILCFTKIVWVYIQSYAKILLKKYQARILLKEFYARILLKKFDIRVLLKKYYARTLLRKFLVKIKEIFGKK